MPATPAACGRKMKKCPFVPFATITLAFFALLFAGPGAARASERPTIVDPVTVLRDRFDLLTVEALDELRLVAPRGGSASGQMVMQSAPSKVTVSDLSGPDDAVLTSDTLRVRYAGLESPHQERTGTVGRHSPGPDAYRLYYDLLYDAPEDRMDENPELTPIWLTAAVPADQKPGRYSGTVEVDGHEVPVVVEVSGWQVPRPVDWVSRMHLVTSPETLADRYDVELWSEPHWELVRRQMEFADGLGNNMVPITIYHRNVHALWPWVFFHREGDEYHVDLGVVERYLDIYEEVSGGAPRSLLLMIWERQVCSPAVIERFRRDGRPLEMNLAERTEDGEMRELAAPLLGVEGSEDWAGPLVEAFRELIAERGWDPEVLMLGTGLDERPGQDQAAMLERLAPEARWGVITHGRQDRGWGIEDGGDSLRVGDLKVGFYGNPDNHHIFPLHGPGIAGGWDLEPPHLIVHRCTRYHTALLDQYRSFPRASVWRPDRSRTRGGLTSFSSGMGHVLLDFWEDESGRTLLGRHRGGGWTHLFYRTNNNWIVAPGPEGPIGTARYEMLREGFQEVEARIKLEMALADGWIEGELAERTADLIRERAEVLLRGDFSRPRTYTVGRSEFGLADDWQGSTLELFELAAEIGEAIGEPRYFQREKPSLD